MKHYLRIISCGWLLMRKMRVNRSFVAAATLALVGQLALGCPCGVVDIGGSYHTTVPKPGEIVPNDHNEQKTKLTVSYVVAIKSDPATGEKSFDSANSTVTFGNDFRTKTGKPFVTVPLQMQHINGDANAGRVDSFDVEGTTWDPDPMPPAKNNGIKGHIDLKAQTANLNSSYTTGGTDPTVTSYTFATANEKPGRAKQNSKTGHPFSLGTQIPARGSLDYNAATGTLSIHDDTIIETPVAGDPLLGAAINFPEFDFTGYTTDGSLAIFWSHDLTPLTIAKNGEVFEQSQIPVLFYKPDENLFYAGITDTALAGMLPTSAFFNPTLSSTASPFLNDLAALLDPSTFDFDPYALSYLTIDPSDDYAALSGNFLKSASSGGLDLHFVADSVPEPPSILLVVMALGLALWRSHTASATRRSGGLA